MRYDSRASLLACTFASPCFGRELKTKVATTNHENEDEPKFIIIIQADNKKIILKKNKIFQK
jgi:hypothetical protein